MNDVEKDLLASLTELDGAVKTMAQADTRPKLQPLWERLERLTRQLPTDTDPTLLHYLQKKSYEKARLFLEGRDAENVQGDCGHV